MNDAQILEPKCSFASPKPHGLRWGRRFFDDLPLDIALATNKREENWCRVKKNHYSSDIYFSLFLEATLLIHS